MKTHDIPAIALGLSISTAALAQNHGLPNPRPTSNTEMPAMPPLPGAQASPPTIPAGCTGWPTAS